MTQYNEVICNEYVEYKDMKQQPSSTSFSDFTPLHYSRYQQSTGNVYPNQITDEEAKL